LSFAASPYQNERRQPFCLGLGMFLGVWPVALGDRLLLAARHKPVTFAIICAADEFLWQIMRV